MPSLYNINLKDMTSLADFQPLSIAKINILYHQSGFYGQIYHSVNFKRSPKCDKIRLVDTFLDGVRFRVLAFQ